jgi:glycosyltransferase involved in cell wall biosynthesis
MTNNTQIQTTNGIQERLNLFAPRVSNNNYNTVKKNTFSLQANPKKDMKVTIITVTLNSARFLEDCIKSVIGQDYKNIEHIIIDGGSTDETLSIILKYGEHIACWLSEKDHGMYDAINKGMKMATGDILGTLNSDDILSAPDVISGIVTAFDTQQVDAVYGDLVYVEQQDTSKIVRVWKGVPFKRTRYKYGWMPAHPTFYFKRNLLEDYGYYETHYFTASDYEFMARYLFYFRVSAHYIPKLIVKMRHGGMSNGNIFRRLRANRRDYLAMKRNRIPFPFFVSLLKPLIKLHQYKRMGRYRNFNPVY